MFQKFIFIFLLCFSISIYAQEKTTTIKVRGNCEMCKMRIEYAVSQIPTAKGQWDITTKVLNLSYDENATSLQTIMKRIAQEGHDNELYLADDEVYRQLPDCCKYDREIPWENIENSKGTHGIESSEEESHDHEGEHDHDHAEKNQAQIQTEFEDADHAIDLNAATVTGSKAATSLDKDAVGLQINLSDKELLKAACCNLSESFETNATVDVSYTNAVSGTKQLKMLGLEQKYTLLTKELLPEIRGISSAYGLNFIPGRWIESIQLVKGGGSVVNGYEAIAGHINTELYKSFLRPKTSLNIYGDTSSRFEANAVHNDKINDHWGQSILLHGNATTEKQDHNDDGFMDQPIGKGVNLTYLLNFNDFEHSGFESTTGLNYLNDHRLGGQTNFVEKNDKLTTNAYGIGIDIQRFQVWNKTGYIFKGKPYQSIGFMNQFTYHEQESYFGLKPYDGEQRTYYSNLIFESIINNTAHKFKAGASFLYDIYDEMYVDEIYKRKETVPGIFAEYTYLGNKFTAVLGGRVDFHNLAGTQFTPRLNLKYELTPQTIIRASAGRGFRTANIFAESQAWWVSNRRINIKDEGGEIYGLDPEIAWNYGLSLQQELKLFGRKSSIVADFFRTDFQQQIIVDLDQTPQTILFYNLDGTSYANSFQFQWDFQPIKRLEARIAYKYYDTQAQYLSGKKEVPFMPKHRGFLNLAYGTMRKSNGKQWNFDTTLQWVGKQRIPHSSSHVHESGVDAYGDDYFLLNAQISHHLNKTIRIYLGGDNLLSYTQHHAIIDAENPFGSKFDAGMIYAPIMPANIYLGLDIDF